MAKKFLMDVFNKIWLFCGGEWHGSSSISIHSSESRVWKLSWSLHIPHKVLIFMWKASKDFTCTAANLFLKHVSSNRIDILCKLFVATSLHCMFYVIWFGLFGKSQFSCLNNVMRKEEIKLSGIMAWAVWVEIECVTKRYEH